MNSLVKEIDEHDLKSRVEIILIDDCSSNQTVRDNNRNFIANLKRNDIQYSELDQNIGLSAMRNLLAHKSSGTFLLILDADVVPDSYDYISNYLTCLQDEHSEIICGGISYKKRILFGREYDFYLYLSSKNDVKSPQKRGVTPWRHIHTNTVIKKWLFLTTPVDKRFVEYGYEDCEWGIRLTKKHRVSHIDNTVSHLGLISKEVFYERMRKSIVNYLLLSKIHPEEFQKSHICKIANGLIVLNSSMLEIMDAILAKMFASVNNNRICFFIFQFNKAVLFAKQLKKNWSAF